MELPTKTRQFRRVNNEFMYNLQAEMEKNPAGSYGALFVVAKGLSNKEEWKLNDKDSYSYEVLGGTHLSLATKVMHERQPNNPHFAGRMLGLAMNKPFTLELCINNHQCFNMKLHTVRR